MSREDYAALLLQLANLAVWLVLPGNTLRFRHLVHVEATERTWYIREWTHAEPLYIGHRRREALNPEHLTAASQLSTALGTVSLHSPLWMAVRCLWGGLVTGWFHNRYLLIWIALESLFGPRDPGEVRYRLSQQLAFFLAEKREARYDLFRAAKKDYAERSKVVHGEGGGVKRDDWEALIDRAEEWVRAALVKILKSPELIATFSDPQRRDELLEGGVFFPRGGV